jgi:two-component system cell cycle response regulator DivK
MKTILIVEDNPLNLELVSQLLEDDFEILTAEDGIDGVEMALAHTPDLILMDLSLPRLDGWAATEKLRDDDRTHDIPILAVTAHAIKAELDRALAAGCNAYLTKPIDEDLLLAAVQKWTSDEGEGG